MPHERLPKQALCAKANGRRQVGRPRTRWNNCMEDLERNLLELRPSKTIDEVWRINLELRSPTTLTEKRAMLKEEEEKINYLIKRIHKRAEKAMKKKTP